MNRMIHTIIILLALLGVGCSYDTELRSTQGLPASRAIDDDDRRDRDREREERDDEEEEDEADEGDEDENNGSGLFDEEHVDEEDGPVKIDYPRFAFFSQGHTTYELKDQLPMSADLESEMDENELLLSKQNVAISCGGKGGCDQGDVNDKAAGLNGTDRYDLTDDDERKELGDKYRHNFAIFADRVTDRKGRTFTFSQPLPVYPWPAPASRYEPLENGPLSYSASVEISDLIPHGPSAADDNFDRIKDTLARQGQAINRFDVTITVERVSGSGDQTVLRFVTTISQDYKRQSYGAFPIPRDMTFTIEGKERLIEEIQMESWHHGSRSRQEERNILRVSLCEKETKNDRESFSCR